MLNANERSKLESTNFLIKTNDLQIGQNLKKSFMRKLSRIECKWKAQPKLHHGMFRGAEERSCRASIYLIQGNLKKNKIVIYNELKARNITALLQKRPIQPENYFFAFTRLPPSLSGFVVVF
jgi:hypothetical protein